jgi:hypothetical protein
VVYNCINWLDLARTSHISGIFVSLMGQNFILPEKAPTKRQRKPHQKQHQTTMFTFFQWPGLHSRFRNGQGFRTVAVGPKSDSDPRRDRCSSHIFRVERPRKGPERGKQSHPNDTVDRRHERSGQKVKFSVFIRQSFSLSLLQPKFHDIDGRFHLRHFRGRGFGLVGPQVHRKRAQVATGREQRGYRKVRDRGLETRANQ